MHNNLYPYYPGTKKMNTSRLKKRLSPEQKDLLLKSLEERFRNQMAHRKALQGIRWDNVKAKLEMNPAKLWSLYEMERTGGEPNLMTYDKSTGDYIFMDCSAESPKGRRSVCYDREALEARKEFQPENNARDMAAEMGIEILTEQEYLDLQNIGAFDEKTSSWLRTPAEFRKQGGALFGDRRYGRVFIYQNSAESYYKVRGFRGSLRV
jgi:hypothetical protein